MLKNMIAVIINAAFAAILNMNLYTDRAMMANGEVREWHRSPAARLSLSDQSVLLYLQLAFAAVSVITSIMMIFGADNKTIKTVRLVSTATSALMFIVIMIVTSNTHVNYA